MGLLCVGVFAVGQKMKTVQGEGRYSSRLVEKLPPFHSVSVRGDIDVEFLQQPIPSVRISGPQNLVKLAHVRVEDGTLLVGFAEPTHVRGEQHLRVAVTGPRLQRVYAEQAGTFEVRGPLVGKDLSVTLVQEGEFAADGVSMDSLNMVLSGRAEADINEITAEKVSVVLADRAEADLSGEARQAQLENQGASTLDASHLHASIVEAVLKGRGDIQTWVSKRLEAHARGGGRILYKGAPHELERFGKLKKIVPDFDD